jgi:hypothetical protein
MNDMFINSSSNINRMAQNSGNGLLLTAFWGTTVATQGAQVGVHVRPRSGSTIADADVIITIHQVVNGQKVGVAVINARFENNQLDAVWQTAAAKGGEIEAGIYHFKAQVGNYPAVNTAKPLELKKDVARVQAQQKKQEVAKFQQQYHSDSFQTAKK